jgi:radical SAM protein with 4Fe4S-binding SPASM domain
MNGGQGPFSLRLEPEEIVALERTNLQIQDELRAMLERVRGKPLKQTLYKCGAAQNTYHIDPYGQLNPCILSRSQSFNLLKGTFFDGWEKFLPFVTSKPAKENERCDRCDLLNLCGQCPGK